MLGLWVSLVDSTKISPPANLFTEIVFTRYFRCLRGNASDLFFGWIRTPVVTTESIYSFCKCGKSYMRYASPSIIHQLISFLMLRHTDALLVLWMEITAQGIPNER